jgi:hypothetical protein
MNPSLTSQKPFSNRNPVPFTATPTPEDRSDDSNPGI